MIPQIASFSGTLLLATGLLAQEASQPLRMTIPAFGTQAEVEIRDLPPGPGEAAATAALHEIFQLAALADPDGDAAGELSDPGQFGRSDCGPRGGIRLRPLESGEVTIVAPGTDEPEPDR